MSLLSERLNFHCYSCHIVCYNSSNSFFQSVSYSSSYLSSQSSSHCLVTCMTLTQTEIHRSRHAGHLALAKVIYEASRDMCKHTETQMHTFAHVKTVHIHLWLQQVQAETPPVEPSVTFPLDLIPASALTDKHTHAYTKHTHILFQR